MKFEPQMNRGQKGLVGMLTRNALRTLSPFIFLVLIASAVAQELPDAPLPIEFRDGKSTWHQLQELPRCTACTGEQVKVCWQIGDQPSHCTPPGDREFLGATLDAYRRIFTGSELKYWMEPYSPPKWYGPASSNKAVLKSWKFWGPEAIATGLAFADARKNNCNPKSNAPCGADIYRDALIPMAVLVPLHFVTTRFLTPLIAWGSCGYIAGRHVRGMVTGVYP